MATLIQIVVNTDKAQAIIWNNDGIVYWNMHT